jgi:putative tryptophan/tyrosine transport system substrate-binding protein
VALQQTTNTLPIVFVQATDPVAAGFVASLARPGGNITGFAVYERSIAGKWLEMLSELAPRTVHFGVIYDPANTAQGHLPDLESALSPGMHLAPYQPRRILRLLSPRSFEAIGTV